jgi:RNA polymerase sigma-70 factor (ECF subfamily)
MTDPSMTMTGAIDESLYAAALAGEESAFVSLYRRWQGSIYRFALRTSGSAAIAEDVTQEVFLALIRSDSRFDPALGSFSAYVHGIARNHVLRRLNRERLFAPLPEEAEAGYAESGPGTRRPADPLMNLTREETLASLYRAIAALPYRYREVVVLCELQELGYSEAARVIGCPEGTIRSRLHRARILLLNRLRDKEGRNSRAASMNPVRYLPWIAKPSKP